MLALLFPHGDCFVYINTEFRLQSFLMLLCIFRDFCNTSVIPTRVVVVLLPQFSVLVRVCCLIIQIPFITIICKQTVQQTHLYRSISLETCFHCKISLFSHLILPVFQPLIYTCNIFLFWPVGDYLLQKTVGKHLATFFKGTPAVLNSCILLTSMFNDSSKWPLYTGETFLHSLMPVDSSWLYLFYL